MKELYFREREKVEKGKRGEKKSVLLSRMMLCGFSVIICYLFLQYVTSCLSFVHCLCLF